VLQQMHLMRELFRSNLTRLREETGLPMATVASHGDFVNRKLGVCNWEILRDGSFREEVGVELEVYDEACMRHITSRHADTLSVSCWRPSHPIGAIQAGEPAVYVLVHPRQWRANFRENLVDDLGRLSEGLRYALCRGQSGMSDEP
jgi:hypothetical protein